ncbi:hypothetical protein R3P38DRAFT_2893728 [Favolaschia claudopus]|uniref:Uncharacterized protein n=1 Tax=Favolaschia claudopus TaxID=2862362 RepID=A0AAW0CN79_9AGAR
MASPSVNASPDIHNYFSPKTAEVLNTVAHKLAYLPLSSHALKRQPSDSAITSKAKIARMGDVNMANVPNLRNHIIISDVKSFPVNGWTFDLVKANHTDEVVDYLNTNYASCLALVFLSSDLQDRTMGSAAAKSILAAAGVPGAENLAIIPPMPKVELPGKPGRLTMPWTHIIRDCTADLKESIKRKAIFHGRFMDDAMTCYLFPANPPAPFLVFTFHNIDSEAPHVLVRDALLAHLKTDDAVKSMLEAHHTYLKDIPNAEFALDVLFDCAEVSTSTFYLKSSKGSVATNLFHITIPPFDLSTAYNDELAAHVMSATFSFPVRFHGVGKAWRGRYGDTTMDCSECHSNAHYIGNCTIVKSAAYREVHGVPDEPSVVASNVPTSLAVAPALPTPVASTSSAFNNHAGPSNNPYRGGFNRGGFRGGRGGGWNNARFGGFCGRSWS